MTLFSKVLRHIQNKISFIKENAFYGKFGKNSRIVKPMRIFGKRHIYIGNSVHILNGARIEAVSKWRGKPLSPKLRIGDGTSIEQSCHIIAADELKIGRNCCFSAYVYVADCSHKYVPGKSALETELDINRTSVGDGVFIGIGAKIMPGVCLGDGCIVGANAVVTHDIPPYCAAAGVPARVIKKYNFETKKWEKTK